VEDGLVACCFGCIGLITEFWLLLLSVVVLTITDDFEIELVNNSNNIKKLANNDERIGCILLIIS
jgi:hypothetical protein